MVAGGHPRPDLCRSTILVELRQKVCWTASVPISLTDALRWRRPRILGNHPQQAAAFSEGAQQSGVPFVSGVQQAFSA
jgi:hypothetical protein